LRYRLLPYLYTLNYEAHMTGAPIARPLFFSFPQDPETYGVSKQFLLGPGVLVSPVLYNSTTSVNAYFPKGSWYNLNDMTMALKSNGEYITLQAPMDTINVHVGEGMILPMQRGGLTTTAARMTPFTLIVAFPLGFESTGGKAKGHLFLDGGEDVEMKIAEGQSTYIDFSAESDGKKLRVMSQVQSGGYALSQGWVVEKLVVLGLSSSHSSSPASFHLDGKPFSSSSFTYSLESLASSDDKIQAGAVMNLTGLALPVGRNFDLSWMV